MNKETIIFPLFGYDELAKKICDNVGCQMGDLIQHDFPDGETMIKIKNDITGKTVVFITSLDRPNNKIIPLILAAEKTKELGAKNIMLVATYLAYMRQDKAFHEGESFSAKYFAKFISTYFDELITIDPHLHRIASLGEIYSIPTKVLHAADKIAKWISENVQSPLVIGPDEESKQWAELIAQKAQAPFVVLNKIRRGDHSVEVSIPNIESFKTHTPILIDDIISTAKTMIATVRHLKNLKMQPPICIGIHAVFAHNAYQDLINAGVSKIITCNTIQHQTNAIDVSDIIAKNLN